MLIKRPRIAAVLVLALIPAWLNFSEASPTGTVPVADPATESSASTLTTPTTTTTIPTVLTSSVASTPEVPTVPATELAEASERISVLNEQIAAMTSELDAAEEALSSAASELEAEKIARAADAEAAGLLQGDLFSAIDTAQAEVEALSARLDERDGLADRLAALEAEKESLVARLGAERDGVVDLADWPTLQVSGFDGAKPRIGKWKLSTNSAEQTNPEEFFSRLDIPLEQRDKSFLYRFSATSGGKGWVGLGLHFFASNVKSRQGYGEGRSLLLWFTRDPAVRKTDSTWLQLYRSDTDVIMERVLDAKLEESVGELLTVETIYDPDSGIVSISVNGRLAVRYRAWFGIEQGVGVSLRTLGAGGRFSDFEIRTMKD